jgi:hypothetical protein
MEHYRANPATLVAVNVQSDDSALVSSLRLVEVWGDTVDLTHLAWSVCLGTGISVIGSVNLPRVRRKDGRKSVPQNAQDGFWASSVNSRHAMNRAASCLR